jgi:hypothetical protein
VKRRKLALLVLCTAPLLFGAGPATQPSGGNLSAKSGPTTRPDRLAGSEEAGGRRGGRGNGQRQFRFDSAVTQADWEGISSFMKNHSPNRLKFINQLPDGPRKYNMITNMVRVSRNLDHMDDADLSRIVTKRVELEDKVFGLAVQYRNADSVQVDGIKDQLKEAVADLVDTNIDERKLRIDRLKKTLDLEQQNLDRDDGQRDKVVADRLRQTIDEAQRPNGPLETAHSEPVLASPEADTVVTPVKK